MSSTDTTWLRVRQAYPGLRDADVRVLDALAEILSDRRVAAAERDVALETLREVGAVRVCDVSDGLVSIGDVLRRAFITACLLEASP